MASPVKARVEACGVRACAAICLRYAADARTPHCGAPNIPGSAPAACPQGLQHTAGSRTRVWTKPAGSRTVPGMNTASWHQRRGGGILLASPYPHNPQKKKGAGPFLAQVLLRPYGAYLAFIPYSFFFPLRFVRLLPRGVGKGAATCQIASLRLRGTFPIRCFWRSRDFPGIIHSGGTPKRFDDGNNILCSLEIIKVSSATARS